MTETMKQRVRMLLMKRVKKKLLVIDEAKRLKLTAVTVSMMMTDIQNMNC